MWNSQQGIITTPSRMLVPYLILRSAALRNSILAGSVIRLLLSLVLWSNFVSWPISFNTVDDLPIDGGIILFRENGDQTSVSMLSAEVWERQTIHRHIQLTSLKLSTALTAPDPPPTMITPFPKLFAPVASNFGWRDELLLRVLGALAVTWILPSLTCVSKECRAIGPGASSVERDVNVKRPRSIQLHTYVPSTDIEAGCKNKDKVARVLGEFRTYRRAMG